MIAERRHRLLLGALLLIAAGALYVFLVLQFGIGIACPFERLTGYQCPGCGVSGMFLSLLKGDLSGAFSSNPLTFLLLPAYAGLGIYLARSYVLFGHLRVSTKIEKCLIALIGAYILFGIARNIY